MSARLDFRSLAKHRLAGCKTRADELAIYRKLKRLVSTRLRQAGQSRKEIEHYAS